MNPPLTIYAGIDPHMSPRKPHTLALCTPQNNTVRLKAIIKTDRLDQIILALAPYKPTAIAVDAPLTPPPKKGYRPQEKNALKHGARLLPPTLPQMRLLTRTGILLAGLLKSLRWHPLVLETHPTSTALILKHESLAQLAQTLGAPPTLDRHGQEALACCLVAYLAHQGKTINHGGDPPLHLPPPA